MLIRLHQNEPTAFAAKLVDHLADLFSSAAATTGWIQQLPLGNRPSKATRSCGPRCGTGTTCTTSPQSTTSFLTTHAASEEGRYYMSPPQNKDRYEWGYPCSVKKLPIGAPTNQRYIPNAFGLSWGSYPNPYPTQCGTTIVKWGNGEDSGAAAGADFNGRPEYVWLKDKAVNCTAIPAPHEFLQRGNSRFGGQSSEWFHTRFLRAAKLSIGGRIMGGTFKDVNTKGNTTNDAYAFAGILEEGHSKPVLRVKKKGFANDILWRKKPSNWSAIRSAAAGLAAGLKNVFSQNANNGDMTDGKGWWPNVFSKYQAAFMCESEKDCGYFVFDPSKKRMQMCQGQEIKPKEGMSNKVARGKAFGYLLARKMRGYMMGVKPSFLRQALKLNQNDRLLINTKAVCPGRDGRFLETRPFAEDLRDTFKRNAASPDVLRPTHWWYNLAGSKTFYMQPSDVRGELCSGEPTFVPQLGAFAVIPEIPAAQEPMLS
ncbi:unnamed protein product [Amoebophrya sp. A120]|nr:unnamed protein product [Amoebophrya sp. A120]|eukprot:GSA120T00002422001.1